MHIENKPFALSKAQMNMIEDNTRLPVLFDFAYGFISFHNIV